MIRMAIRICVYISKPSGIGKHMRIFIIDIINDETPIVSLPTERLSARNHEVTGITGGANVREARCRAVESVQHPHR